MQQYDEVAVERALAGDRTVRLYEPEQEEVLRRVATGEVSETDAAHAMRLSGAEMKRRASAERGRLRSHCVNGHAYSRVNTRVDKSGGRHCRKCENAAAWRRAAERRTG